VRSTQEISAKSPADFGVIPTTGNHDEIAPSQLIKPVSGLGEYRIIRRNGAVVGFEPSKISIAVTKAFLAVNQEGHRGRPARSRAGALRPQAESLPR
jgi:ribonucleoside-diphosphate reductase alpha chain